MKGIDLIDEITEEITKAKEEKAKRILKIKLELVQKCERTHAEQQEEYAWMLNMDIDDLIEKYDSVHDCFGINVPISHSSKK